MTQDAIVSLCVGVFIAAGVTMLCYNGYRAHKLKQAVVNKYRVWYYAEKDTYLVQKQYVVFIGFPYTFWGTLTERRMQADAIDEINRLRSSQDHEVPA